MSGGSDIRIDVPQERLRKLAIVGIVLSLVGITVAVCLAPTGGFRVSDSKMAIIAVIGVLVGPAIAISSWNRLRHPSPLLVIDEAGLRFHPLSGWPITIELQHLGRVRMFSIKGQPYLGIEPSCMNNSWRHVPGRLRRRAYLNRIVTRRPVMIAIPGYLLGTRFDEVAGMLVTLTGTELGD